MLEGVRRVIQKTPERGLVDTDYSALCEGGTKLEIRETGTDPPSPVTISPQEDRSVPERG